MALLIVAMMAATGAAVPAGAVEVDEGVWLADEETVQPIDQADDAEDTEGAEPGEDDDHAEAPGDRDDEAPPTEEQLDAGAAGTGAAAEVEVTTWNELVAAVGGSCQAGATVVLGANIANGAARSDLEVECDLTLDLHGYRLTTATLGVAPEKHLTLTDESGAGIAGMLDAEAVPGSNKPGVRTTDAALTITGHARVKTLGASNGAGIGGGWRGDGGTVTITGDAEVEASSGVSAAGVGGGYLGSGEQIVIDGRANVTAVTADSSVARLSGGAAIGGGHWCGAGTIVIRGQAMVFADSETGEDATWRSVSAGIGSGAGSGSNGCETSGGAITIAGGAQVEAVSDLSAGIGHAVNSRGLMTVDIEDNAMVTARAIGHGAGIGGGYSPATTEVSISDNAVVDAESDRGAGIGGGLFGGEHTSVEISGEANVTAKSRAGAGIGGGVDGDGAEVTIVDEAEVTATSRRGAGIGGGERESNRGGRGGTTTIAPGATVTASSTGETLNGSAVGPGNNGSGSGPTTVAGALAIPEGELRVPAASEVLVEESGLIRGPATIPTGGASITGEGTIVNEGVIALTNVSENTRIANHHFMVSFTSDEDPAAVTVYGPAFDGSYRDFPTPQLGHVWNTRADARGTTVTATTLLDAVAEDADTGADVDATAAGGRAVNLFEVPEPIPVTVAVEVQRAPVTVGTPVVVDASVIAAGLPEGEFPEGAVEVYLDDVSGDPVASGELTDGEARVAVAGLDAGEHSLVVHYTGDMDRVTPGTADPVSAEVLTAGSETAFEAPEEVFVGAEFEWSATVRAVESAGAADPVPGGPEWVPFSPSGEVQLLIDGEALGDPVVLEEGDADDGTAMTGRLVVEPDLDPGEYVLTVNYLGEDRVEQSLSSPQDLLVVGTTETVLHIVPDEPVTGEAVTLTASVSPERDDATWVATGEVTFSTVPALGAMYEELETIELVDGVAELEGVSFMGGVHSVRAIYASDRPEHGGSDAEELLVVGKAPVTVDVTAEPQDREVRYGEQFSVSAQFFSALSPDDERDQIFEGHASRDGERVKLNAAGEAIFTVTDAAAGEHTDVVSYEEDAHYLEGAGSVNYRIAQAGAVVEASPMQSTVGAGSETTVVVRVAADTSPDAAVTGAVELRVGDATGAVVAASELVDGSASLTASFEKAGSVDLVAVYAGDGNVLAGVSDATPLTVMPAAMSDRGAGGGLASTGGVGPALLALSGLVLLAGGILLGARRRL